MILYYISIIIANTAQGHAKEEAGWKAGEPRNATTMRLSLMARAPGGGGM